MTIPTRLTVTLAIVVSLLAAAASSRAAVDTNVAVPFDAQVFVPCADSGLGEVVNLTGALHVLLTVTANAAGGVSVSTLSQPMGISGIGESSGDTYRATGVTRANLTASFESHLTLVNNFRIIGPGPGNNFLVHETLVITINANGTVTVAADHFSIDCK